jgi:hypothetical protein
MKAINFPQVNLVIGKGQNDYQELPAFKDFKDPCGTVIACLEVSDKELEEISKTKKLWIYLLTFNSPLQPFVLTTENPFGDTSTSSDIENISGESK